MDAASTTEEPLDEVTASTPVSGVTAATVIALISARTTQTKQYRKHYSTNEKRAVLRAIEGMGEREASRTQETPCWALKDWRKSPESIFGYTGSEKTMVRTPGRHEVIPFGIELITFMKDTRRDSEVLKAKTMAIFVRDEYHEWLEGYVEANS
ncbi:hypothetical protein PC120_g4703 [Phytophthora cactorum]|nr:hypothetical protein PC120_g4703 [Phytophthora cactorum]